MNRCHAAPTKSGSAATREAGLVENFNLNFSTMDYIFTPDDKYIFPENNAYGQFLWMEQKLPQLKMAESMAELLVNGKS